ncbi:FAD/NAD(P)-binding domain-containing protein [Hypoxylon rubiginosum]|uniref:FAD/NAD(P)-binding domain-containing protein n=1 Tax=Hypoxylon rubiginosum TaxID=110542 RepID=A0ACB9ZCI8_9PEZI|nr:FAD/NAD(P)-binding domain-containing protein [Hypoxylon rubiginosum]
MDDTNGYGAAAKASYAIREEPLGTPKHVRIVGIGAGASGINLIRTIRKNMVNYEHVVYEKNEKVGGTWFENRYPGCRCDVPSHNYQFSWRPNPEWSNFLSPAPEIQEYLSRICEEEHMMDTIKLRHKVNGAWWDEKRGLWDLSVQNLETGEEFKDYANFLVDASGILNNWKWPEYPGIKSFKGDLVHTASWPKDFDYSNKTVAVIGNGASGIQLLPAIQPDVKKLYHFIRTPTWIIPPRRITMLLMGGPAKEVLEDLGLDEDENFSQEQIERFKTDPAFYQKFVKAIERDIGGAFPILVNGSPAQADVNAKAAMTMTRLLGGDKKLCEALIPKFPLGCRRVTPGPGYLEALQTPNTELVMEGIARVVPEGIQLESGKVIKLDAIMCATGFDNSFAPPFPIVGRHGNVQDTMKAETPKSYMSLALAGLPNYFTFMGPNAPIGHGSVFTLGEHVARYITRLMIKCQTEGIKAVAPSDAAVDDYARHVAAFMPRTSWSGSCRSWFKSGDGEGGAVTALHPGSRFHFFHMLDRFRGEDWEYVLDDDENPGRNRFYYLGNGFSTKELDPKVNVTWYLDEDADRL